MSSGANEIRGNVVVSRQVRGGKKPSCNEFIVGRKKGARATLDKITTVVGGGWISKRATSGPISLSERREMLWAAWKGLMRGGLLQWGR